MCCLLCTTVSVIASASEFVCVCVSEPMHVICMWLLVRFNYESETYPPGQICSDQQHTTDVEKKLKQLAASKEREQKKQSSNNIHFYVRALGSAFYTQDIHLFEYNDGFSWPW